MKLKFMTAILGPWSFLSLAMLLGCGNITSKSVCMANCPPVSKPEILYATGLTQVSAFTIDASTGVLTAPITVSGLNDSVGTAASPTANLLFVSDFTADAINVYSVNTSNGALTAISGSPFVLGNTPGAAGLVVDPAGKVLYEADGNAGAVNAFSISSSGVLSPVSGTPFPAGNTPLHLAIAPNGKFLYASNTNDTQGGISAYMVDSTTGALTEIPNSPFATQSPFGGPGPLAVHSSGKFLYVAMPGSANANHLIFAFTIDSTTGALSPITGSPFSAGNDPLYMVLDSAGKFLYVSNTQDNSISGFTIDSSSGILTPIAGSPYSVPSIAGLAIEASGKFLYVSSANTISGFSINSSSGALTTLTGSPFAGGTPGLLTSTAIK